MTAPHPDEQDRPAPLEVSRLRSGIVHASLLLFAVAIVARAAQLQVFEGAHWATEAAVQHVKQETVTPPRGNIYDATGSVLAESRELFRIGITPRNVQPNKRHKTPRKELERELRELGVPAKFVRLALDTARSWVELPGEFMPGEVEAIAKLPGVTRLRVTQRFTTAANGMRRVVGVVDGDGVARGGIEQEFDSLLTGTSGRRVLMKNPRGLPTETPELQGIEPTPGHRITLTLNQALQDIAERELLRAMKNTGSSGGDMVIVDVRDGAILAMAGARDGRVALSATAVTQAYEPGSIMKTFLIASMLDSKRAAATEVVNTENGRYVMGKRTLTDEHKAPSMSVTDIVRWSSNIGTVKLASRLAKPEQYQLLRDYGFGIPTGLPFPSESPGALPLPARWSETTQAAIAIGYEIMATPVQLALAYAVIANGGELLQPALVREIHSADGELVYRHERRVLRRVLSDDGAAAMRVMLGAVVDSGTATAARLAAFDIAGKSGTARISQGKSGYGRTYNASFAGMFPAQRPQVVFLARLIEPQGKIFGGLVAAPMAKAVMQSAIALQDGSLDRTALAAVRRPIDVDSSLRLGAPKVARVDAKNVRNVKLATAAVDSAEMPRAIAARIEPPQGPGRVVVSIVDRMDTTAPREPKRKRSRDVREMREVPFVEGLNLRQAVATLYAAGFEVSLTKGAAGRTSPAAGAMVRSGSTVTLGAGQ